MYVYSVLQLETRVLFIYVSFMVECLYYITIFEKRFTCLLLSYLFIWFACFIGGYSFSNIIYLGFCGFIFVSICSFLFFKCIYLEPPMHLKF